MDVEDSVKPLQEINKVCFSNQVKSSLAFQLNTLRHLSTPALLLFSCVMQFTLLLSWSNLEAGRYLETLKAYESKPSASIQERVEDDFLPQLTKALKNIPSVNKTDVLTMLQGFQNLRGTRPAQAH